MSLHSDESNWQTFKRLWTYIRLYKAGLVVSTIALVINAAADTYMISLLKPLLDEVLVMRNPTSCAFCRL